VERGHILEHLASQKPTQIKILHLPTNLGKGEAVRTGILKMLEKNTYDYVGFWDADISTPLETIDLFIAHAELTSHKIIMGSRLMRLGTTITRKHHRHFLGRIFAAVASTILQAPIYDSQCGAKIFHKSTSKIFKQPLVANWGFDVELVARYRNIFGKQALLTDAYEYPISSWTERGNSKLKLRHMLLIPLELIKIHKVYNGKKHKTKNPLK
jgi:glycosyltransferase involved in cell wall biosynthesis